MTAAIMARHHRLEMRATCCVSLVLVATTTILLLVDTCSAVEVINSPPADRGISRADWKAHTPLEVPEHLLSSLVQLGDIGRFNETLSHILVPRVVGTPGHAAVNAYIQRRLRSLGWLVETDAFAADTPNLGRLQFENIIATHNPKAKRFLTLACHYDSKYFKDSVFLGASDSAVPCAMLIDLVESLDKHLQAPRTGGGGEGLSLRLVFFDGEEAFQEWTAEDSVYGARHLAQRWQEEGRLEEMDMLVLLDLLGLPGPTFYSYFRDTETWYAHLANSEQRLADQELVQRDESSGVVPRRNRNAYFQDQSLADARIDDDHVPFLQRGVPIVHLIPVPFPTEWHTPADDWHAVDFVTVDNLQRILRVFLVEYLHLPME